MGHGGTLGDSLRLHIEHEVRHYYDMESRPVEEVMQRYSKAIRGEDERGMYGDVGVMLAFTSRFNVKLLVFTPPVVVNTRTNTTKLYRPLCSEQGALTDEVGRCREPHRI